MVDGSGQGHTHMLVVEVFSHSNIAYYILNVCRYYSTYFMQSIHSNVLGKSIKIL